MAVKIGHAVHSETGGREGVSGDQIQQQGKRNEEVQLSKWYVSGDGWGWYIEAKDPALRERMATLMEQACANPNIGYSRTYRQRWYTTARANGGDVTKANGDCDCSSLVSGITNLAGANVKAGLSTATMLRAFKASGEFNIYTDDDHIATDKYAKRGGIYLRVGHTLMVLENGSSSVLEPTQPIYPTTDIKPPYVLVIGGKVNVRTGAGISNPILYEERNGSKLQYLDRDDVTGWYCVDTAYGLGYISSKANLTKLVEA